MRYPLLLWKYKNPHYDQTHYNAYKRELEEHMGKSYRKTKQEFKEAHTRFIEEKSRRDQQRRADMINDIFRLAAKEASV